MIEETFVASDPKSAYEQAVEKYGFGVSVVSAKQLQYEDGQLRCEVVIAVPKALFMEKSFGDMGHRAMVEEVKALFIQKGIHALWLEETLKVVKSTTHKAALVHAVVASIDRQLKVKEESLAEPKLLMLVGTTGVGKTTAIAKMAARYSRGGHTKVALLNLDIQKAGAIEQLAHYAKMLDVEAYAIDGVETFKEKLKALSSYDVVLVDSGGLSPYDTHRFLKTIEFVRAVESRKLETHLVLPATLKYEDMQDMYTNFSFLQLDGLLVSKFDETRHFGALLSFLVYVPLPLSYFSIGQAIPQDLMLADKEYLLEVFTGEIDDKA